MSEVKMVPLDCGCCSAFGVAANIPDGLRLRAGW